MEFLANAKQQSVNIWIKMTGTHFFTSKRYCWGSDETYIRKKHGINSRVQNQEWNLKITYKDPYDVFF